MVTYFAYVDLKYIDEEYEWTCQTHRVVYKRVGNTFLPSGERNVFQSVNFLSESVNLRYCEDTWGPNVQLFKQVKNTTPIPPLFLC